MTASLEIICIGNELLIGKILNTNAHWLGKNATNLGITVKRITVIPDEIEEIAHTIQEALQRKPQFIITTGGLGPTFDDKTLQGLAMALNRKLEVNEKALKIIREKYVAYAKQKGLEKIELTKPRVKMATIPEKAELIHNPIGTAPGVCSDFNGTVLFALPGVPSEMEAIFNETIAPLLMQSSDGMIFCEKSLHVDGMVESSLAPLIDNAMQDNEGVYIKSHPLLAEHKPHIETHLTITAKKEQKPLEKLEKALMELASLVEQHGGKTDYKR